MYVWIWVTDVLYVPFEGCRCLFPLCEFEKGVVMAGAEVSLYWFLLNGPSRLGNVNVMVAFSFEVVLFLLINLPVLF